MRKNSGFTLIEMLVVTFVIVVIGGAVVGLQYLMGQNQVAVLTGSFNVDQANSSLAGLTREIRTARAGEQGAYLIESADPQSLVFYSDIDSDGLSERVRYFMQGTSFRKGVIKPSENPATYPANTEQIREITSNVRNGSTPIFTYFNEDGQTTNNVSRITLIRIYLRVNQNANDAEHDYVLETSANVRTLKENL